MTAQGAASCYSCGYGETCAVGIPNLVHGPGVKITAEMIPDVGKQPDTLSAAKEAGRLLGERLRVGHDRARVTQAMQGRLMAAFSSAV